MLTDERASCRRALRVVLADDHPFHRGGLARSLRASGIDVLAEAPNGEAALRAVDETAPDVVPMDLRTPGLSGLEVTRRLTERTCVRQLRAGAQRVRPRGRCHRRDPGRRRGLRAEGAAGGGGGRGDLGGGARRAAHLLRGRDAADAAAARARGRAHAPGGSAPFGPRARGLDLLAAGITHGEIAAALEISFHAVRREGTASSRSSCGPPCAPLAVRAAEQRPVEMPARCCATAIRGRVRLQEVLLEAPGPPGSGRPAPRIEHDGQLGERERLTHVRGRWRKSWGASPRLFRMDCRWHPRRLPLESTRSV
jgi:hypothetical protein